MNIYHARYTNEKAAREHLESVRWPDGPFCPHCGSFSVKRLPPVHRKATAKHGATAREGVVQCNEKACRQQFTVTVGTVFERSKVPLFKWLLVNHLMVASKKGISAHQVHRMIGVTYKTAWFMCHRIREAMTDEGGPLGGEGVVVEADEAFVGGSQSNRAFRKVAPKKAVVTLVERDGRARSFHVANVTGPTLRSVLVQNVDRASTLATDGLPAYGPIGREFKFHGAVEHMNKEFARTSTAERGFHKFTTQWHSNTAENFFSIFKRGVIGTYHHMSEAHLHRYCREFDFRYNHRKVTDGERADAALAGIFGKRLTYRRPHAIAA